MQIPETSSGNALVATPEFTILDAYERDALAAICALLRSNRKLIIAYSGGKDSTAMLLMALNAAKAVRLEGISFPPILITHGDTGIENPTVVSLVRKELSKAWTFGRKHGFEVQAEIASPMLNDTWAVSILGGRKLPTFASASSRDCTVMFKIAPMERLRNRILRSELAQKRGGPPVTMIGTRFEESDGRAARMSERGETAYTPWEKDGSWFMSPIANWSSDDVWEYIGRFKNGESHGFTTGQAVWDMYADAGATGTCAIVADMATEGLKKTRACGARFGCALCAAVGRDKSLENMMLQPQFNWLRHLNKIQRFIVDTQWDWSRRNWVGRSIIKEESEQKKEARRALRTGKQRKQEAKAVDYLKIEPDTYSPAMLQELLRYCLTADRIEERDSRSQGIPPRFQLVTPEQLLAIDALWSLNGIQERPFTAVKIWDEVYNKREQFFPPKVEPVPHTPMPAARYIYVGSDWDGGMQQRYTGFRNVMQEGFAGADLGGGCVGTRELSNGLTVMDIEIGDSLGFDPEAMSMFFEFELEYVLRNWYHKPSSSCRDGFFHYVRLNMIETSNAHVQAHVDRIMRRTAWRQRNGLVGEVSHELLVSKSISKSEMLAELATRPTAPVVETQTAPTPEQIAAEMQALAPQMWMFDFEDIVPPVKAAKPAPKAPHSKRVEASLEQDSSAPQLMLELA